MSDYECDPRHLGFREAAGVLRGVPREIFLLMASVILLLPNTVYAMEQVDGTPELQGWKSIADFSQSLSQWAVLIVGGSIAILIGTGYWRPNTIRARLPYLLFLPAWGKLFESLYMGAAAQRNILALLNLKKTNLLDTKLELSDHVSCQISSLEWGLGLVFLWLLYFLAWWVFADVPDTKKGGG